MRSNNINDEGNVYVWDSERRSSLSSHFVGSQVDNLFYLESHGPHTRATVLARPATQTTEHEHECAITIRKTTPGRGSVSPPGHHHRSNIACIELHGLISNCLAVAFIKTAINRQLFIRRRTRSLEHSGANGGGSVLSGEDTGLDAARMHYMRSYRTELRTFHCECVRKMPLSRLDPSVLIIFLYKTETDWTDLRRRWQRYACLIFARTSAYRGLQSRTIRRFLNRRRAAIVIER